MIRYVFVTRNLTNGPLLVGLLENRILELRKFSPGARAVIFFAKGVPPECDSDVIEFRAAGRWPAILWHLVNPFILRNWTRQEVGMRSLILRRGVLPNPLIGLVFSGKRFLLFTEHHTKRMAEFATVWNLPPWLIRPLFWLDRFAIDKKLAGKICVTSEIADSESFRGKTLVVANPINGEMANTRRQPVFDGEQLRIAMPINEAYTWHGVDRLIKSAVEWAESSPKLTVCVTLFGVEGESESPHAKVTVERSGQLTDSDLRKKFQNQHLGISTLGLARSGKQEACPLKSRFFVSSRIPFIYGYLDPDIPSDSPVTLRVPNDESLIPWPVVENFLSRVSSTSYDAEWSALQHRMSLTEKTRILANFVEEHHLEMNKRS